MNGRAAQPDRHFLEALLAPVILETVASAEHDRWSHWQTYLHDQCHHNADGTLTIPAHLVERWTRQAATSYADLPADQQTSDRDQASALLAVIADALQGPSRR